MCWHKRSKVCAGRFLAEKNVEVSYGGTGWRGELPDFAQLRRVWFSFGSGGFGRERFLKPVGFKELAQIDGALEVEFFDEERVGAKLIGAVDVANLVGGGQYDNGKAADAGLAANPTENFETIFAREL